MPLPRKNVCPLLKAECIEHSCRWWTQVIGKHPNTGEELNRFSCAVEWLPVLLIENSQQQRQTGAAVESFRNEMVRANASTISMLTINKGLPAIDWKPPDQ